MTSPEVRADAVIEALRKHPMLLMALQRKLREMEALGPWVHRKQDQVWERQDAHGVSRVTVRRVDDGPEMSFHGRVFYNREDFVMPSAREAMEAADGILEGLGGVLVR